MFGLKKLLMKKMMEKQLKDLPPAQRDMMLQAVTENPDFFKKMNDEIEAEVKKGKPQMAASMEVMRRHQGELQKLLMGR